jgi:hypothetical protein
MKAIGAILMLLFFYILIPVIIVAGVGYAFWTFMKWQEA